MGARSELDGHSNLWGAIKTIIVADFVMSLDNVLGVAAAAKGNVVLLVIGLAISIPLIIYGSTIILKMMNRWPIIVMIGGGILGWVAVETIVIDGEEAPPPGYHWVTRPWRILPNGRREYALPTARATSGRSSRSAPT